MTRGTPANHGNELIRTYFLSDSKVVHTHPDPDTYIFYVIGDDPLSVMGDDLKELQMQGGQKLRSEAP